MIWPFIITGLVSGSVYGLAAVGLVLTYKTSGLFNFAHGAVATAAAYLFYTLYVQLHLRWPIAAVITIFGLGPLLALFFERLAKAVSGRSLALAVTSTVGVFVLIPAAITLIYGEITSRFVPVFLAHGSFKLAGTYVQYADLVTFVFAVVATSLLYLLFRLTRAGAEMRAVVQSPELLELTGTSATRVRRLAWLIGICFACASGVLLSTVMQLDPLLLTLIVAQAFGAAAIGAFRNLPLTFVGGLAIGVLASIVTKYVSGSGGHSPLVAGIPPSLPFLILFGVLLLFPRKYLRERSLVIPASRPTWVTPLPVQLGGAVALVVLLAFVPSFAGVHVTSWTIGLTSVILFLSLGLLVRTAGQVSLCHVSFMAIGACAFSHLAVDHGVPWLLAFALSALIAVPVGVLLAIPAIRLTPLYLALATFGFGVVLQDMFYTQPYMFGNTGAGLQMPRPPWLGMTGDRGFYYFVLAVGVVISLFILVLERSRLGRLLRGMADAPTAVATSGAAIKVTWVLVFCLSAAIAALAGALSGMAQSVVSVYGFAPLQSLTFLALVIIVVGGVPWYAVAAGLGLSVPPSYFAGFHTTQGMQLAFGVFAVLYAITPDSKRGAPQAVRRALDALFRRSPRQKVGTDSYLVVEGADARVAPGRLTIEAITVRFGGLVAVDGASLDVPTGRITGLIGPNGAGKTTIFNACSGLVPLAAGRIEFDGHDLVRMSPAGRARRGLGRTFQQMQLFDSLTVRENVAIGVEAGLAGANPVRHAIGRRRDAARVKAATAAALHLCDLHDVADRPVGELSTGQRRLVELARCLAGPFRVLLLDEPSAGLDRVETARFGEILSRVVEERGVGILLVEHDMALVMDVCAHIYVLDFGHLIYEGTPEDVRTSAVVQAAYLGGEAAEDAATESLAAGGAS